MQRILRPRKKTSINVEEKKEKPPLDNWSLFRKIEKEFAPNKPRTSSSFSDNYSAGLSWRGTDAKALFENPNNPAKLLELCADRVMEHAARRVDLFFYVLVAYHKTQIPPILGWTRLQHGRGKINFKTREGITHAAHSSLTTAIIDRTILDKTPVESIIKKSNFKMKTSMLCATHFMDSLNSTIELPVFVNDFDFLIEFKSGGRDDASKIIRLVAEAKLTPMQGLLRFVLLLKKIFDKMLEEKTIFTSKTDMPIEVKRKLVELEKKGTLINKLSKNGKSINDDYIFMLLRLKADEIAQCKLGAQSRNEILSGKMLDIQKEIIYTPSSVIYSVAI